MQKCWRSRVFGASAIVIVAGVLAASIALPRADAFSDDGSVLTLEARGYTYTYHVPTGGEALFDTDSDPGQLHNVLASHPGEASRMRRAIEQRLHVQSLEALRSRCADTVGRLRSLGYL